MIRLSERQIEQIQNVELEMLVEFDRICRKYDIKYSIDGGTLLGAIRHGGFIPWDDDADVIMTRKEYAKFLEVVDDEIDYDRFYLQDMERTAGYRWGYSKLRRKNTVFIRENQEHMPYEQGIFMDIFVCDFVPDFYLARVMCNINSFIFRKLFYAKVGKISEKGLKQWIYCLLDMIPERFLKNSFGKYIRWRNRKDTQWVKCLTFPACNNTLGYKREWYEDVIELQFENTKLMGCKKYEEYLSFLYGDYMQLPPIEKRKVHPVSDFKIDIIKGEGSDYE